MRGVATSVGLLLLVIFVVLSASHSVVVEASKKRITTDKCTSCKVDCLRRSDIMSNKQLIGCARDCYLNNYCSTTTTSQSTTGLTVLKKRHSLLKAQKQQQQQEEEEEADYGQFLTNADDNDDQLVNNEQVLVDVASDVATELGAVNADCTKCKTSCTDSSYQQKLPLCLVKCAQSKSCKFEDNLAFTA